MILILYNLDQITKTNTGLKKNRQKITDKFSSHGIFINRRYNLFNTYFSFSSKLIKKIKILSWHLHHIKVRYFPKNISTILLH